VGVGGADRTVTIWEVESGRVLYKVNGSRFRCPLRVLAPYDKLQLPGHKGTVTAVDFHPKEPVGKLILSFVPHGYALIRCPFVVLTASTDATMLLGEIDRIS
jgi:Prp8 binding protein